MAASCRCPQTCGNRCAGNAVVTARLIQYGSRPVTRAKWIALWGLAGIDLVGGLLLLLWPGAWQEWLHPGAIGTTFYPLQAQGATWLARGGLTAWFAWRRSCAGASAVGFAWAVEGPSELLLAWRVGDAGPYALGAHLSRAALAAIAALGLIGRRPVECAESVKETLYDGQ